MLHSRQQRIPHRRRQSIRHAAQCLCLVCLVSSTVKVESLPEAGTITTASRVVLAVASTQQDADGDPEGLRIAAASSRGVNRLGYGTPASPAPPRPSYGGGPTDFTKGYEGNGAGPGDPWNREADLKARDFQLRYGPQPEFATPPRTSRHGVTIPPNTLPTLPKPPLPGDPEPRSRSESPQRDPTIR